VVEDHVIVELKMVAAPNNMHIPQCRNHPRATSKPPCLQINVGCPKVEIRRITAQA
jgi:hypothetical protein